MAVTCAGEDRELTIQISGEIDHHGAGKLMTELDSQLETRLPRAVTLDLSGVTFMDSSGIAVLLRAYKRMNSLGGSLTVIHVPKQAERVLRASGLYQLLHITEE